MWPASVDSDTVARYKGGGCDFLVANPEGLQLAALEEDDLAFFLALSADLDDRFLRVVTIEDKVTIHNAFPDRRFKP